MPCDHNPVTIFPTQFSYITINGEQVMTLGAVRLVYDTSGTLPIDRGGTGAVTPEQARNNLGLGTAAVEDVTDFATAAQGDKADTALQPGADAAALASGPGVPLGYVLIADGAEGADWAAPPGGGTGGGLDAVEDDPAPKLGGNLEMAGHRILATDNADAFHGALGYSPTVGALFLSENTPGEYFEDKAGVSLKDGLLSLHGSRAQVKALIGLGNREVWTDPDGNLYPVEPAPPAWDVEDQSTGKIGAYGDVSGTGAWVKIPNLSALTEQAVAQGDAVGCTTRAYINNLSPVGGDLEFGWGIGSAQPAAGAGTATVAVVQGQKGYVTANHYQEALANLPAGTEVAAWVRALGPPEFGPWIDGSMGYPHYLTIEAVGQPAQSGDVIITTDTTVYVEVTGSDTTGDGTTVGTAYATVQKALDSLIGVTIQPSAVVTIQMGSGNFTFATSTTVRHPSARSIVIAGAAPLATITGIVEADFTDPTTPVPGTRGAYDLHNTAGMLAVTANASTRTAAQTADAANNLTLLQSVYPTQITTTDATAAFTVYGGLKDLRDILCISCGVLIATDSAVITSSTSIASVQGGTAVVVTNDALATLGTVIAVNEANYGLNVNNGAMGIVTGKLLAQGCKNDGVYLPRAARVYITEAISTGGSLNGLSVLAGSECHVNTSGATRTLSCSGNGAAGLNLQRGGKFHWSGVGATTSFVRLNGNATNALTLLDSAEFDVSGTACSFTAQGAVSANVIAAQRDSLVSITGPATINRGYSMLLGAGSRAFFGGSLTLTNPNGGIMNVSGGASVSLAGAISAPQGLGTNGIQCTAGTVKDFSGTLAALATDNPTKFTPAFGKVLADGSRITGGPTGAAGLTTGETKITLDGADIIIAALAGVGNRTVKVDANGRLFAE